MKNEVTRRNLFKRGGLLGAGVVLSQAAKASSIITPQQGEGPFYPRVDQIDKDADLTKVEGRRKSAKGEVVLVHGTVKATDGSAISGAFIDIWQACESGKYNHEQDPNTAPLDPDFQYWARLKSDNRGEFSFKTIIPGAYPASNVWIRPPHIHFRVDAFNRGRLTTQMYFKGNELNDTDRILVDTEQRFGKEARDSLVVDFSSEKNDQGIPIGRFEITLGQTPNAE